VSACWIVRLLMTMQRVWKTVSVLWPRWSGFVPGPANVRFVVALGKVCHQSSSFLVQSSIVDVAYCQNVTNQPTNLATTEQSIYWEANSFSASQTISRIYATQSFFPIFTRVRCLSLSTARSKLVHPLLCNQKFLSHLHEIPLLVPLHSQIQTSPPTFM
jgi:hypothetical protein